MDTEKCKAALYAVELGSLSAAAEKLGYTTSGISRMMQALEEEEGFPLLVRSRGGVAPTEAMKKLAPVYRELIRWADTCAQVSAEISGAQIGSVTVGLSYSAYFSWIAEVIGGFRKDYPAIEIHLLYGNSSELTHAMIEHKADFCIVSRRETGDVWIPLIRDPMVAWVPGNHPLAEKEAFPVSAFETEPFIDFFPGTETDNTRLFAKLHIHPNIRFSSTDAGAAYAMVGAGLGVTLNNSLTARDWHGRVKVLPLDPPQYVDICITYPDREFISPAAGRFVDYALRHAQKSLSGMAGLTNV